MRKTMTSKPCSREGKVKQGAGIKIVPDLGNDGHFIDASDAANSIPKIDVVFPVLHGTQGEDGAVQGLLELVNVAYVGCPVAASASGMDKVMSKHLFDQANIPQAQSVVIYRSQWRNSAQACVKHCAEELTYPLFIKPANLGSSVGISKAHDVIELHKAIEHAYEFDDKVLVETSFENCAEVECAVLGNHVVEASVVGEIVAGAEFYDYDAKYINNSSETYIPADISAASTEKVRELAIRAFQAILGQGLARVDFFVSRKTGEVWLNEINTMPGFTPISMYPKLWEASGLPYPQLINRLVQLADERHLSKIKLRRSY